MPLKRRSSPVPDARSIKRKTINKSQAVELPLQTLPTLPIDSETPASEPPPTPKPRPNKILSPLQTDESKRSRKEIRKRRKTNLRIMAKNFTKFVQVIKVPYALEDFENFNLEDLEKKCEELAKMDSQCISAKFVDKNGKTIFVYCGSRVEKKGEAPPRKISLKNQYRNRTQAFFDSVKETNTIKKKFDGLHPNKSRFYQIAVQSYIHNVPFRNGKKAEEETVRHEAANIMSFTTNKGIESSEKTGMVHLVHGWTQQGNPKKGLYISGDISRSSSALSAATAYYGNTGPIAEYISIMFQETFPDVYREYKKAFKAGVWLSSDSGPFLGRAVIYKLQGRLHKDRNDVGPSVSFPVGDFDGGEMLLPQLGAKFRYESGAICIFYSSILFHKVLEFKPKPQTSLQKKEKIIPGRIGTVMFFPKRSLDVLKDKPKRWAFNTDFGKNEDLYNVLSY